MKNRKLTKVRPWIIVWAPFGRFISRVAAVLEIREKSREMKKD